MQAIRTTLDRFYLGCGILAAMCLVAILILIVLQMVARWTGEMFTGAPDYAGYAMAAASFLGFAYALNHGSHIRVSLLLGALGRHRKWGEFWCFGIGTALSGIWAYYAIKMTYFSWKFGDISQAQDATPIWIPQVTMVVGTSALFVAFVDHFIRLLLTGQHGMSQESLDSVE